MKSINLASIISMIDLDLINSITNITKESLILSFVVFVLTMLIKKPLKTITSKLNEDKRKAINTIILLIPLCISFILSLIGKVIFKNLWQINIAETATTSWILSLTIYGIVERILIIVKGIKCNEIDFCEEGKELISEVKNIVKKLKSSLKTQNQELKKISKLKIPLEKTKEILETTVGTLDLAKLSKTNIEIQSLTYKENKIQEKINEILSQIESYTNLSKWQRKINEFNLKGGNIWNSKIEKEVILTEKF